MRKIEIKMKPILCQASADKFIEEGHRHTTKKFPHILSFTFKEKNIDEEKLNIINWYIDLLQQAYVIKNDIDKIFIETDARQSSYLIMKIG